MKIAVVGAGAIGLFVGAALVRGGADVTLVARDRQLKGLSDGVRVLSPDGGFNAKIQATSEVGVVGDVDVVVLAVKAYSLTDLAPRIGTHLDGRAVVLPMQNGVPWWLFHSFGGPVEGTSLNKVDPGGAISEAIDSSQVVGCVVFPATELVAPGVVRHIEGTRFTIGELDGTRTERCRLISRGGTAGGLKCPIDSRIRSQLWLKLIGNVAFNILTALTGATLGELKVSAEAVDVARAVMLECAAVGGALGIDMSISVDRRLEAGIAVGDHRTSMLQDLENGKPLEIDCLSGAVIEIAETLGITVPHTRAIDGALRLKAALRNI
jgi:2-dehydropantoate 2-reductase